MTTHRIGRATAIAATIMTLAAIFADVPATQESGDRAQQPNAATLSLDQAVDAAIKDGEDYKLIQANLEAARAADAQVQASGGYSLVFTGHYGLGTSSSLNSAGLGGTATLSGPSTQATLNVSQNLQPFESVGPLVASLSITQTIWDGFPGGQTQATLAKSRLTFGVKQLAAQASVLTLVYTVKQAYYTMLSAQRTLATKLSALDKQKANYLQVKTQNDTGVASDIDLLNAEIGQRSAEIDVASARNDLRSARALLSILTKRSGGDEYLVADVPDPTLPAKDVDEAVRMALAQNSPIKQLELNRASSQIDLALAQAQSQFSVQGYATGSVSLSLTGGTSSQTWSVGVKLTAPTIDSGVAAQKVAAAQAQLQAYDIQERQLRASVEANVRDAWESVLIQAQRVALALSQADATEQQLKIVGIQRDSGTAANVDYLTALYNQISAQAALGSAKATLQLYILKLANVMGY
jgi:outer membrane protein